MLLRCHPLTASHAIKLTAWGPSGPAMCDRKGLMPADRCVPASRTGHAIPSSGLRYPIGPVGWVWHVHSCPSSRLTRLFGTVPLVPTIRTYSWDTQKRGHVTRPVWLRSDHVDGPCGQTGRDGRYGWDPISNRLFWEAPGKPVCTPLATSYLTSVAVTRHGSAPGSRWPWRGRIQAEPAGPGTFRVSAMQARCPVCPSESDCPPLWSHREDTCATKQSDC